MSDIKNTRSRYNKLNTQTSNPSDFILSTDDFQSNEKVNDIRRINRNKHNNTQIILLIFTALSYLLHTLRAYIPATLQTDSSFWSSLAIRPITRVYTSDLRPSLVTESLLFRLAENWQTFWLLYVLSYIPRRTHFGYLYRNPDIFNSLLCFFLITALALQTISQLFVSPEVSCACLCVSLIFLIITCRLVAVKLFKYGHKYRAVGLTIDQIILRYFVLNSLFLYTTSIVYSAMCAIVEYIGIYLDLNAALSTSTSICTTIGLLMIYIFLFVYFLVDQFVYNNEFWSIWTPYLFIAYAFICPPLRQVSLLETDIVSSNLNFYLLWGLFMMTVLMICLRLYRQMKKKKRINSHDEHIN